MDQEQGKSSQIFCLAWVKQNVAKLVPDQIELDPEEMQSILKNENLDDENQWTDVDDSDEEDEKETQKDVVDEDVASDDDLKEFDLDNYDDEEENVSSGVAGLVMFANNDDDPYITRKKAKKLEIEEEESEGEEEEKSSLNLRPDDNLLVCARCSQHSSTLEIYVYNHKNKDFYVHHDIPLSETPLCMQWIGFDPGAADNNKGNLIAVGNFNSVIDIWDLDILNTLEPVFSIGKKKLKKKRRKIDFEHTDAILDLAWTESVRDQLASASADTVVALWDLELGKATQVFQDHHDKVQSIEWKPNSRDCLLSGAFDGRILALDARTSKHSSEWSLDGEIERVTWDQIDNNYFAAGTDGGTVYYVDSRKTGSYLHKWAAHSDAIPGLIMTKSPKSKAAGKLLYTASSDGCVKLWDVNEEKATMVHEREMKMGMVHCCKGNPDVASVVALGGQRDSVKIWDVLKTPEVLKYFGVKEQEDECDDTMDPLGGGGDDDDDVIKYLEGEDYINQSKIDKLEKEEMRNKHKDMALKATEKNGGNEKKKRKRKRKKNSTNQDTLDTEFSKVQSSEMKSAKDKKRKRRKNKKSPQVTNNKAE